MTHERFSPNDIRQLLFQGSTFVVKKTRRFLREDKAIHCDGGHLVLEDTKGAYYLLPLDLLEQYRLSRKARDQLERGLGGDAKGYGHFNPHHMPVLSPGLFRDRVKEVLASQSKFYQGGLFKLPREVELPEGTKAELEADVSPTALVLQNTQGDYYVVPVDVLRRHVVSRKLQSKLDAELGLRPPHDTW